MSSLLFVADGASDFFMRFGSLPVIGEVLAGILVGPSLFGNGFSSAVFPADTRPFLTALGNVGVAMFIPRRWIPMRRRTGE